MILVPWRLPWIPKLHAQPSSRVTVMGGSIHRSSAPQRHTLSQTHGSTLSLGGSRLYKRLEAQSQEDFYVRSIIRISRLFTGSQEPVMEASLTSETRLCNSYSPACSRGPFGWVLAAVALGLVGWMLLDWEVGHCQ